VARLEASSARRLRALIEVLGFEGRGAQTRFAKEIGVDRRRLNNVLVGYPLSQKLGHAQGLSRVGRRTDRNSGNACGGSTVNPVHQAAGVGLGCSVPAAGTLTVGQRVARSLPERWPAVSLAETHHTLGSRPSTRAQGRGSPVAAPFNREQNGRQDHAYSCFARGLVARLHSHRLDCGSRCLQLGLRRACCGRLDRRRLDIPAR
jgi:hypothetical protein